MWHVARGTGIVTLNSPSGSTLQCDTWLWDDMSLNLPGGSTLQCGMSLWNDGSEFTKWQHPAMWHVALGWHFIEFARWQHSAMWHVTLEWWQGIHQVAAPCNVTRGSGMTCYWILPNVCHIGILHLVSIFSPYHRSRHVILHQSAKMYPNQTTIGRKNDVMSIFKMADLYHLGFYGSNNGFF